MTLVLLLQADQKFCILKTSICPTLIYPFQTVPQHRIPYGFLIDADKMIRCTLKEILQLPSDLPDSMIYSQCKFKGFGLFRSQWEAQLQQINSLRILHRHSNPYVTATRDVVTESINCLCKLQIKPDNSFLSPKDGFLDPRKIRNFLRDMEYNKWCELPTKGKGNFPRISTN